MQLPINYKYKVVLVIDTTYQNICSIIHRKFAMWHKSRGSHFQQNNADNVRKLKSMFLKPGAYECAVLLIAGLRISALSQPPADFTPTLRESIPRLLNEGTTAMTACCAPACSQALPVKPQGVWARGIEAWARSRDRRNWSCGGGGLRGLIQPNVSRGSILQMMHVGLCDVIIMTRTVWLCSCYKLQQILEDLIEADRE